MAATNRGAADGAIVGGQLVTLDPRQPKATAISWRDGTIVAVGGDAEVRASCDARTEVLDGRGLVVTPGLTDAHIHPHYAEETRGADLSGCFMLAEVEDRLVQEVRRCPPDEWVLGWGLEYGVFDGDIRQERLNSVKERPALLTFMDCHTALATAPALAAAGIESAEGFEERGDVIFSDGRPTGELRELVAMDRVRSLVPRLTQTEIRDAFAARLRELNRYGITTAHVMTGAPDLFDCVRELEAAGELSVRLSVPLWLKPETSLETILEYLRLRDERGRLWTSGVAKFFIDGVIDTGTAWLFEPDTSGGGLEPFWPDPGRYAHVVWLFAERGFRCVTHAVGDRAVAAALDAYRGAQRPANGMHRIEHLETLRPQELARLASEGVAASMQPLHMQWRRSDGSDSWTSRLGPKRAARAFPTRSITDAGVPLALGSDWPVASFDPRVGMAWARFREPLGVDQEPFEPEQRLTGDEVLRGYTAAPALLAGENDIAGMLRTGYRADISGFGADLRTASHAELLDLPISLTVVDGQVRYRDGC